jgi:hypothetical protein
MNPAWPSRADRTGRGWSPERILVFDSKLTYIDPRWDVRESTSVMGDTAGLTEDMVEHTGVE